MSLLGKLPKTIICRVKTVQIRVSVSCWHTFWKGEVWVDIHQKKFCCFDQELTLNLKKLCLYWQLLTVNTQRWSKLSQNEENLDTLIKNVIQQHTFYVSFIENREDDDQETGASEVATTTGETSWRLYGNLPI